MDLPRTIELKDGELLTPLHPEDVLEAVEEYAGKEVRDFIDGYIEEQLEEYADCQEDLKRMEREMDQITDHQRSALNDIREELEILQILLDASRLDRRRLQEHTRAAYKLVWAEL